MRLAACESLGGVVQAILCDVPADTCHNRKQTSKSLHMYGAQTQDQAQPSLALQENILSCLLPDIQGHYPD